MSPSASANTRGPGGSSAVDRASDRSVFKQIADDIRGDIQAGVLGPGDRIPSETQLMDPLRGGADDGAPGTCCLESGGPGR